MIYMLDTNIIIYAKNSRPAEVARIFFRHHPSDLCISSITLAELEYGVCKSSNPEKNRLALMSFLAGIEVVPFDALAAQEYGLIRHQLQSSGKAIGSNDLLIAAHAKSKGLTLATANTREFERVEGLLVDNWVEA